MQAANQFLFRYKGRQMVVSADTPRAAKTWATRHFDASAGRWIAGDVRPGFIGGGSSIPVFEWAVQS